MKFKATGHLKHVCSSLTRAKYLLVSEYKQSNICNTKSARCVSWKANVAIAGVVHTIILMYEHCMSLEQAQRQHANQHMWQTRYIKAALP